MLAIAIKGNAWAIAIGHNHPSANAQPSMSDKAMTERIHQACALLDIMLIDHIILLPPDRYYSFSDHGLLKQPNNKQSSYVKSSTTP